MIIKIRLSHRVTDFAVMQNIERYVGKGHNPEVLLKSDDCMCYFKEEWFMS